jgi:hypothetical protein
MRRASVPRGRVLCARLRGDSAAAYDLNDSHFHLTNYIQEGTNPDLPRHHGEARRRVALFGIPLQQQWSVSRLGRARAELLPR